MKFKRLLIILLFPVFLVNCDSSSKKGTNSFEELDKSLINSTNNSDDSLENLYTEINSKRENNLDLALIADSIYKATALANDFVDSLKKSLQMQDTSGLNTKLSTKVFIKSQTGDILKEKISNVYKPFQNIEINAMDASKFNRYFNTTNIILQLSDWKENYFNGVSTFSAITVLTKFQNDYQNAAKAYLTFIKTKIYR